MLVLVVSVPRASLAIAAARSRLVRSTMAVLLVPRLVLDLDSVVLRLVSVVRPLDSVLAPVPVVLEDRASELEVPVVPEALVVLDRDRASDRVRARARVRALPRASEAAAETTVVMPDTRRSRSR